MSDLVSGMSQKIETKPIQEHPASYLPVVGGSPNGIGTQREAGYDRTRRRMPTMPRSARNPNADMAPGSP